MKRLRLGKLFGIDIFCHWSLIIFIVCFVIWDCFFISYPFSLQTKLILSFFKCIIIYISILGHEFGHMFAAKIRKFEVGDVELNFFGGKASILDFPVYKDEFYITISGPLVSLLLFVIGYIPFYLLGQDQYNLLLFMVAINLVMFIFNMLPILPMDGGKVLRSILCKWFNYLDATRICVILSKILCIVLAIISLLYLSFWMIIAIIYIWVSINGEMENAKIYQNWFDGVEDDQES